MRMYVAHGQAEVPTCCDVPGDALCRGMPVAAAAAAFSVIRRATLLALLGCSLWQVRTTYLPYPT